MWFRNLQIYRLPKPWAGAMQIDLCGFALQPCAPSSMQSIGWIPPRPGGTMQHVVNRQILLTLGVEQRLMPASVVKRFASDRAKAIEEAEGRKVGRKEMRELREAAAIELMPKAFIRRRATFGWIDPINGWLVIDSASPAKAEEFLEHLRKSVEGLPAKLVKVNQSPSAAMTRWVAYGEAPSGFTIDQDMYLRSAEKAEVRYVRHTLEGDDIHQHISAGKVVTRLALTWADRISFVLTEDLQIKRLAFLDIIKDDADGQAENEDERFDIDFTLMSGEVARLLDDLVAALGGDLAEQPAEIAQPAKLNDKLAELNDRLSEIAPDAAYDEAVKVVRENQRASISLVQRHLRIGHNHAARLIEDMERAGVVSAMDSTGNREILENAA